MFAPLLMHVQSKRHEIDLNQQASYWKDVETPYDPFYAYEEVPAAFKDEPGSRIGVLAPNERIAYWITDERVSSLRPDVEELRRSVVDAYAFTEDENRAAQGWSSVERISLLRKVGLIIETIRWWLKRRRWQFAVIAISIGAGLMAVQLVNSRIAIGTLVTQAENARGQVNQLQSALTEERTRLEATRGQVNQVQNTLTEERTRLEATRGQVNQLQNTLTEERTRLEATRGQVNQLQNALAEERARRGATRDQVSQPEFDIQQRKSAIGDWLGARPSIRNALDCRRACSREPMCQGYAFASERSDCVLYSSIEISSGVGNEEVGKRR
jgi:flagellar biosynthesis chaperone FliJ